MTSFVDFLSIAIRSLFDASSHPKSGIESVDLHFVVLRGERHGSRAPRFASKAEAKFLVGAFRWHDT